MRLSTLLLFCIALLASQCQREHNDPFIDQSKPVYSIQKGKAIQADFSGIINDLNGSPIPNAQVHIGDKTAYTDEHGSFLIFDAKVYSKHAYVKVKADGFFHGSRTVYPQEGVNQVRISMLPDAPVESISSMDGGVVERDGARVVFGGGFIDQADGRVYSGKVNVSMHYLNPEADNLDEIMPGSLMAGSYEGQRLLQTFGMIAVELKGSSGQLLQLNLGNEAELHMPLSPEMKKKATSTIPLWYFDEERGYWQKDGQATIIGDEYVGKVKHFSFWNCDIPRKYNHISGMVKTTDDTPIPGAKVTLLSSEVGSASAITTSTGKFEGPVPSDFTYSLSVQFLSKNGLVSKTVGPFSSDEKLDDIIIDMSDMVFISGKLIGCDSQTIASGMVKINNTLLVHLNNGVYKFAIEKHTPYSIVPIDRGRLVIGDKQEFPGQAVTHYMEDIKVCDPNASGGNGGGGSGGGSSSIWDYRMYYEMGGKTFEVKSKVSQNWMGYRQTDQYIELYAGIKDAQSPNYEKDIHIEVKDYNGPGNYTITNTGENNIWFSKEDDPNPNTANSIDLNVERYAVDNSGTLIKLSFSGTANVWNEDKKLYEVKEVKNGVFTVLRQ